jgi:hypothetical protein
MISAKGGASGTSTEELARRMRERAEIVHGHRDSTKPTR